MKQIVVMLCTAVLFVVAVATANAAVLRPEVEVVSDRVTLGDLFDGLSKERAAIELAQAPAPGRQVVLDAAWIDRVARAYRVSWENAAVVRQVVLRRASHRLGAEAVAAAVAEALAGKAPEGDLQVELDNRAIEMHLPTDVLPSTRVQDISYDPFSGRFTAMVVAPANGPASVRLPVTGRAVAVVEVPVVTRRISRGEVVSAADVDWMAISADRASLEVVTDAGELIGMAARRGLAANTPVRRHELARPTEVRRGDAVTMTFTRGALVITARGKALAEGARGDVIRVVNTDSNRTVEAIITGPNAVSVALDASLASLN